MIEPAHSRDHSDTIDAWAGKSQDHKLVRLRHMFGLQDEFAALLNGWILQCHVGCASVKMLMNTCCASNTNARDMSMTWRSCLQPKSPIYCSIVSSKEEEWLGESGFDSSGVVVVPIMC